MKETIMKENQLTVIEGGNYTLTTPAFSFSEVQQMAAAIVQGGLFPHLKTPQAAVSLMLLCQAEGLHPMQAIQRYHIVQGRPVMRADAMQAAFQKAGGKVEWIERTNTRAAAIFTHPAGGSTEVEWTIDQATKAGLTSKEVWRQYPRQMLSARVIGEGVRAIYPGVCMGLYTPEEAENMPPVRVSTTGQPSMIQSAPVEEHLAIAPAPNAIAASPKTPPFKLFVQRAGGLSRAIPAVIQGKLSKKGALDLLSEIYGQEVAELAPASDHVAWEGHLAALLSVYPEGQESPSQPALRSFAGTDDSDLGDPFADEEEGN